MGIVAFNTSGFPSDGYNRPATLTCDLDFDGPDACDHSTTTICPTDFEESQCIQRNDATPTETPSMSPIVPGVPTTPAPSMEPTMEPTKGSGGGSKDNTGAIVGGVIGGLCGIAIIALIVVFAVRYKNEKAESPYDQVSNVDEEDDL